MFYKTPQRSPSFGDPDKNPESTVAVSLYRRISFPFIGCCVLLLVAACSSVPERQALPMELSEVAVIPGIPYAREWADEAPPYLDDWLEMPVTEIKENHSAIYGVPHTYLAISGGGSRGAFTAGLLNGWTENGSRPEFTVVTGVSTGALIAPFAFLGPEYDHVIKTIYTQFSTSDLIIERSTLQTLTGDAAADSTPLREHIAHFMDAKVMSAIATQHQRGRSLSIVTTNLDAGRPVVWNIGVIAASGAPNALQLIRDVMLASASLPAAFPPVMFDVEANGQHYDEMHTDGGVTSVVHLYPMGVDWEQLARKLDVQGKPDVYVIRNGYLQPSWSEVSRNTISIALSSISALMGSVVYGDMYRIYLAAQRDGLNYHLAYIPEDFDMESQEPFDPLYMTALFELGYKLGKQGYNWSSTPPSFELEAGANQE